MKHRIPKMRLLLWGLIVLQILVFTLATAAPVYADDCERDPLNAADCMRTTGFRQGISVIMSVGAAVTTVAVSVLSGAGAATTVTTTQVPAEGGAPIQADQVDVEGEGPQEPGKEEDLPPKDEEQPPKKPEAESSTPTTEEGTPKKPDSEVKPAQPGTLEQGFNIIKDLVSATGNIVGGFSEYFTVADSPEKIKAIRRALQIWRNSPSLQNADDYLKKLRSSNGLRQARVGDALGKLGKGLDVLDALNKAAKICKDRGYTGTDAAMRVYAELGKKAITWGLTKNPVVALADAAIGGATQMLFGAENKIDIGSTVDKSFDAWDNVTQEAADLYHGNQVADAESVTQTNLNRYLKRISKQVKDGKLTRAEGSKRMRRLMDIMG